MSDPTKAQDAFFISIDGKNRLVAQDVDKSSKRAYETASSQSANPHRFVFLTSSRRERLTDKPSLQQLSDHQTQKPFTDLLPRLIKINCGKSAR
jgi:hypothetical protein